MNAIDEMHARIDTLTSQIERGGSDAAELRSQAQRIDEQVRTWEAVRDEYRKISAVYAKSTTIQLGSP